MSKPSTNNKARDIESACDGVQASVEALRSVVNMRRLSKESVVQLMGDREALNDNIANMAAVVRGAGLLVTLARLHSAARRIEQRLRVLTYGGSTKTLQRALADVRTDLLHALRQIDDAARDIVVQCIEQLNSGHSGDDIGEEEDDDNDDDDDSMSGFVVTGDDDDECIEWCRSNEVRALEADGTLRDDDVIELGGLWYPASELAPDANVTELIVECRAVCAPYRRDLSYYELICREVPAVTLVFRAYDPILSGVFGGEQPPATWHTVMFYYVRGLLHSWCVKPFVTVDGAELLFPPNKRQDACYSLPAAVVNQKPNWNVSAVEKRRKDALQPWSSLLVEVAAGEFEWKAEHRWLTTSVWQLTPATIGVTLSGPHNKRAAILDSMLAQNAGVVGVRESAIGEHFQYDDSVQNGALVAYTDEFANTQWFVNFHRLRELTLALAGLLPGYVLLWIFDLADDVLFAMEEVHKIKLNQGSHRLGAPSSPGTRVDHHNKTPQMRRKLL